MKNLPVTHQCVTLLQSYISGARLLPLKNLCASMDLFLSLSLSENVLRTQKNKNGEHGVIFLDHGP